MDIDHQLVVTEKSCNFSMNYKSVVGFGKIYIVEDENEKYVPVQKEYMEENFSNKVVQRIFRRINDGFAESEQEKKS